MKSAEDSKQLFLKSLKIGVAANIFFIVFIIVCLMYYFTFDNANLIVEIFAYTIEAAGFVLMALSSVGMIRSLKYSLLVKIAMPVYCIAELFVMLLEIGFIKLPFWDSMSSTIIAIHVIFSIFAIMTYISIDANNKQLEITVVLTAIVMLIGAFGYRVYISVLVNTFAFIALYLTLIFKINHEQVDIQYRGTVVEPKQYKSTFFN